MWNLSWGTMLLAIVMLVIFFGLGERVLDRMGLTNSQAVVTIIGILVGSFIDIPLWRGDIQITLNVGGAVIPLILAVYLLWKAGSAKERGRAILAAIATGAATAVLGGVMMTGEVGDRLALIDPLYLYPVVAGLIAYLLGRSRRAAFVAAVLGVMSLDFIHWFWLAYNNVPGNVYLGGAGALDSIVVAGILAVVLAEVVGEIRERLQGGPKREGHAPELLAELRKVGPEGAGNLEFNPSGPDLSKEKAPAARRKRQERQGEAEAFTAPAPALPPDGPFNPAVFAGTGEEDTKRKDKTERKREQMKMNPHRRPYPVAQGEYAQELAKENGAGKKLEEFAEELPIEVIWDRMAQVNAEMATETAAHKIAEEAKAKGDSVAKEKAEAIARRAGKNLEEFAKDGWIEESRLQNPKERHIGEEPHLTPAITEELALELGLDAAALDRGPRFSEDGWNAATLLPTLPLEAQLAREIRKQKKEGRK